MSDNTAPSHSRSSTKLRDILMSDKPTLSYADFHRQITRAADSYLPRSSGSQQRRGIEGKTKEDELVRYMSNLPSYLEKGKNFQEKPLSVGVLDWRRLEQWKYKYNSMPHKDSGYSSSTSSTSYFSTEGSSSQSSRGQSSSPSQERMHRSSLQSHLEASPMKTYSQDKCYPERGHSCSPARQRTYHLVPPHSHHQKIYPWEDHSQNDLKTGNADKFIEISPSVPNHRTRQQKLCGMDQTYGRSQSRVRQEMCEKKDSDSNTSSEIGKQQTWGSTDVVSSWKGKLKIRESELKESMQSRASLGEYRPDCSKEHNTVVLLVPRDPPTNRGMTDLSDSVESANWKPRERGGKISPEQVNYKDIRGSDLSSSDPYSCFLPSQEDTKKKSETKGSRSTSALGSRVSSQQLRSPSRKRNTEEKKPIVVLKNSTTTLLSGESAKRTGSPSTTKVRHPSPIRRLGSAMGSIIRSAGSRDNSPLRRSSSKDPVVKSCLDRAAASGPLDTEKSHANSKARSSPLRRLIDPMIKPKAPNAHDLVEPPRKDYASTAGPWNASDEQLDLLKARPVEVNSTFTNGKTNGGKVSHQNMKIGSSPLQALLQVAVKNGLPLFTFAVDNESDILAATLRKCNTAEKNCSSWIFTFFTVHEIKKKNALWLNKGSKCKGHYVPNVVAQMKVSDSQVRTGTRQRGTDGDKIREFILFSVDVGQVDQHATEFQPTNELAAIVVKLQKATLRSPNGVPIVPSQTSFQRSSLKGNDPDSSNSLQDSHPFRSQIPLDITMILPGGVHTIPSKGSISTLTHRWRSGGSCDCGGWDLGCQLRIYTNHGESQKLLASSKPTNASDEFNLFCQAGQESQLIFSLRPFKDRIYSVEFDSSVSFLQAFATCVAALDCRGPYGLFSTSNMVEGRSSTTSISVDPSRVKAPNQSYVEAPASYVSYPPHSPVGRV